jgi:hypothetical protein
MSGNRRHDGDRRHESAWERWERYGEDPSRMGQEWRSHQMDEASGPQAGRIGAGRQEMGRDRRDDLHERSWSQSSSGYRGPRGQGYGEGDVHRRWDEGGQYGYGRAGQRGEAPGMGRDYGYGHAGRHEPWRDDRGRAGDWRRESEADFGARAGGGRYGPRGGGYGEQRHSGHDDRGLWDRASDEVASWFGDDDAERRRQHDERRDRRRHDW